MNKNRILQVNIDNDGGNGAFALVRYLYSFLKEEYVFDYFTMGRFIENSVYEDIVYNGGKCYSANLRGNKFIGHIKLPFVFYRYLQKNCCKVVHIHSEVAYKHYLYTIAAKKAGIKKIVIHSHSSNIDGDNRGIKYMFHRILKNRVNKLGDYFLACSVPAAEWMFTSKVMNSGNFALLHNGINPTKYIYNDFKRKTIRSEFDIDSKIVIGHVGALKKVKNQERLLDLLYEIYDERYVLMLIGDGDDKEFLRNKAENLHIDKRVLFLGNRTDVSELLQAVDVFVFPSYFEGIPMALIEAQAVGLPIVASDRINKDIQINDNIIFCALEDNNKSWITAIKKAEISHIKKDGYNNVISSKYNIKSSSELLRKIYFYD